MREPKIGDVWEVDNWVELRGQKPRAFILIGNADLGFSDGGCGCCSSSYNKDTAIFCRNIFENTPELLPDPEHFL